MNNIESSCIAFFSQLQAALLLSQMSPDLVGEKMETECFYNAVNVILSLQVRKKPTMIHIELLAN